MEIITSMSVEPCPICLNEDEFKSKFITKYKCIHLCHEVCINQWNKGCPICRCSVLYLSNEVTDVDDKYVYTSVTSIEMFKKLIRVPSVYENLYKQNWKKHECINNNHELIYTKPYGVTVICTNCLIIQCMNLSHTI